ncbi:hypothetical protein QFZ35_001736 [Arthrobacter ulcerisalmonis]|nr:hypothetical protein [Arthrobacter ulcerisalmonis]MDQ0663238.1 hypothetical protein [Arthrobacter ulcerisalmonis]
MTVLARAATNPEQDPGSGGEDHGAPTVPPQREGHRQHHENRGKHDQNGDQVPVADLHVFRGQRRYRNKHTHAANAQRHRCERPPPGGPAGHPRGGQRGDHQGDCADGLHHDQGREPKAGELEEDGSAEHRRPGQPHGPPHQGLKAPTTHAARRAAGSSRLVLHGPVLEQCSQGEQDGAGGGDRNPQPVIGRECGHGRGLDHAQTLPNAGPGNAPRVTTRRRTFA